MARSLRVDFRGAFHHVMNHGESRCKPFGAPRDVLEFLELVAGIGELLPAEVHAYCVLGNHYHLLLRARGTDLCAAIRHIEEVYTERFHGGHGTDGPLFRGRHLAIGVRAIRHLLHVSRYIHLNPVEAGLASRPEDWPHSSYRAYLDPAATPRWLRTAAILGAFGSVGTRRRYRSFVEEGIDPGTRDFYGRERLRLACGWDSPGPGTVQRRLPLAAIARAVCDGLGTSACDLRLRTAAALVVRGAVVHAARRLGRYRLAEIAAWLGYRSTSGAVRAAIRYQVAAAASPALARRLTEVVERLEGRGPGISA